MVAFISCKDDDVEGEYLYIQDELYFLNFQQSGGEQAFELYSNLRGWKIQNLYSSDDEWLDIWPNEGNEDGRFSIKVSENENASSRVGIINVVVNGQVYKTVTVNQVGSNPYIELDMGGISSVTVPAPGTSLNVKLNTNVLWEVEIPAEMSSWISLGNTDVEEAELIVARNSDWDYRSGEITFRMIGTGNEAVYVILSIQQRGLRSDISSATEVTIAELLRSLSAEGGQISENVYVWANVISNKNTLNVDETAISYETEAGVTTATIVDKLM
ncbi:MAG: hypothetical protein LIO65_04425 [Odoribacter sp.]|nr:hypothetical protein [Odoribacter sp.]